MTASTGQSERHISVGKYVLSRDSLSRTIQFSRAPKEFFSSAEAAECFPDLVSVEQVGGIEKLPEYRYHYSGSDPVYSGCLPPLDLPADSLLRVKRGRAFGRECAIQAPGRIGILEFDHQSRHLSRLRSAIIGGILSPRYWKHRLNAFRHRYVWSNVQKCSGVVAALNAPSSHNYFHWMIEILPRVRTLQASGAVPDWYLIDAHLPFQQQTLQMLGVPLDRVIQPHPVLCLEADELLVPSYGLPNGCRRLGQDLVERTVDNSAAKPSRRLFINRRQSRQVNNRTELEQVLSQFGFEEHFLEDYPVATQINLFHQAEVVLGLHGSGLANTIFCRPEAHIIELMPQGRAQLCYPYLSHLLGVHHWLISASRAGSRQTMQVPTDVLQSVISQALAQSESSLPLRRAA